MNILRSYLRQKVDFTSRGPRIGELSYARQSDFTLPTHSQSPSAMNALPNFPEDGLLPAIAQDHETLEILMLAWMNKAAFAETVSSGRACYFSRSRGRLWRKGEESGHTQEIVSIHVDCDADTILLKVRQHGAACHEGYASCFFRELQGDKVVIEADRLLDPKDVYGG